MAEGANVALSLRSYVAYALSKIDYVGAGVWINDRALEQLDKATRAYYQAAMGLGPWARNKYLNLPLSKGGPGAPDLRLRLDLCLAQTYAQATYSRNELARLAVLELMKEKPSNEGTQLRGSLSGLGVGMEVMPSRILAPSRVRVQGDVTALKEVRQLLVASDGAQGGGRKGSGVVITSVEGH